MRSSSISFWFYIENIQLGNYKYICGEKKIKIDENMVNKKRFFGQFVVLIAEEHDRFSFDSCLKC